MSRVDVVVPCYNYGHFLERCVRSVLDQHGVAVRVLILDDCSSDDSQAVGRRLAAGDARVVYRRHDVNRGHIATYNEGLLEWASGDYCLLLSADDVVAPGALVRAALVLDHHPNVGLCYGDQIVFQEAVPAPPAGGGQPEVRIVAGREFWSESCRIGHNFVSTPTAVVRTSVQRAVGGYRAALPHTADLELWLRIAARADVAYIDTPQAFKRMHGENMQVRHFARAIDDLRQRQHAFESALAECRADLPDAARLAQSFRRALAFEAFWRASAEFDEQRLASFEQWLSTAREIDPGIERTPEWRRLEFKQRLGAALWSRLQPWLTRLRT